MVVEGLIMSNVCKCSCNLYAFIASIIIGVIAAVLRYTAVITVTPAFLWVVLGIAVVYLLVYFAVFATSEGVLKRCASSSVYLFVYAALITILASVILLGITFAATSVLGAIITGVLLGALALVFTTTACLIRYAAQIVQ